MEGPTPVSALIHAATMVAAGVYMLVRVGFLIDASPGALQVIAWIGTITAVLAALMATQQNDIKRILAYSTLSQLGYMVMAVGLASGEAAMFHLFTHAAFKALLFLGAGSIIYMLHHEQDIWRMGGLAKRLPITFLTFLVGTLALIGFPGFSGFFSKDAILALAYERSLPIFALAAFTALLTAFYMTRLVVVAFFGHARSAHAARGAESPVVMTLPLILLSLPAAIGGFGFFAKNFLSLCLTRRSRSSRCRRSPFSRCSLASPAPFILYRNRTTEPVDIALFRNRFYLDELYALLIRWTQGLLAARFRICRSLDSRRRDRSRIERRDLGQRISAPAAAGRQLAGLRFSFRARHHRTHLLHGFPLMLLFIVFAPLITALLILVGAPARVTALLGSAATTVATLIAFFFTIRPGPDSSSLVHFRSAKRGGFSSC